MQHAYTSTPWSSTVSLLHDSGDLLLSAGGQKCISQSNDCSLRVLTSEPQHYTFDAVAGEDADQDVIFQGEHLPANALPGT